MIDKNSFRQIKTCNGSQQGGFEELVCQLANLEQPTSGDKFVRKEGAGGDAGVECYWVLENEDEHGWQAKYFLDSMSSNRWAQVDQSVKDALTKHPRLVKYYVCIPLDRTDIRRTGKGGKKTVSMQDEWLDKVSEWSDFAKQKGMNVDFEYWGASKLLMRLQTDTPKYAGRALYWLNSPVLTTSKLIERLGKQEKILGERYTEEFHVELPIAGIFEALCSTDIFWSKFNQKIKNFKKAAAEFRRLEILDQLSDSYEEMVALLDWVDKVLQPIIVERNRFTAIEAIEKLDAAGIELSNLIDLARQQPKARKRTVQHERSIYENFIHFSRQFNEFQDFVAGDYVGSNSMSALLVAGEAGSGKSHLFCDVSKRFLALGTPAVLLLGQHYQGGEPFELLLDYLDLKQHSIEDVLGALDAAGEASGTSTVVFIDAINEGPHRLQWFERFSGVINDVAKFPNLALAISCRSSFEDKLVPAQVIGNECIRVVHQGFRGREHKAAEIYLSKRGIAKPTAPITTPEFSNPLFVKTCANALLQAGTKSWPKGHQGAKRLFELYLTSLESIIARKRNISVASKVCSKSLKAIARAMFPDRLFGVPYSEAAKIVNEFDESRVADDSLLDALIREGALADEILPHYLANAEHTDDFAVRFTYERFCDHFVAEMLLESIDDPAEIFVESAPLANVSKHNSFYTLRGILTALSIIVPEQYAVELYDLLPPSAKQIGEAAQFAFARGLGRRVPSSFSKRTLELFNELRPRLHESPFETLLEVATEPGHPWNAELLHRNLAALPLSERDATWSTFITNSDVEEDDYAPESGLRSIIEWATFGMLNDVEEERVSLALIVLTWLTTTTKRRTRDHATKAISRMLSQFPGLAEPLLEKFENVNDPYLSERLFAGVYGGFCNSNDNEALQRTASWVFQKIFADGTPPPHLLLRDYARGIIEMCVHRRCLPDSINIERCRPPYKSAWPVENPNANEFKAYGASDIENSVFSVMGDFGNYTIRCVESWSPTELSSPKPESKKEVIEKLKTQLSKESQLLFDNAVEIQRTQEANRLLSLRANSDNMQIGNVLYVQNEQNLDIDTDELSDTLNAMAASVPSIEAKEDAVFPTEEDVEEAWKIFNDELGDDVREQFRWAGGVWRNHNEMPAAFSVSWAKRWVCKKALAMWKADGFEEQLKQFEERRHYADRQRPNVERYGKKYQHIALSEFLSRQADNLYFLRDACSEENAAYDGPWQILKRDIDPTIWSRRTHDDGWGQWGDQVWYRPLNYRFRIESDDEKKAWGQDVADLPNFESLVSTKHPNTRASWFALKGYSKWREEKVSGDASELIRDIWFGISSIVVKKSDLRKLKQELAKKDYLSSTVPRSSTGTQTFFRECSWHPSFDVQDDFSDGGSGELKTPHFVPFCEYEWEKDGDDASLDTSLRLHLPSQTLQNGLSLKPDLSNFHSWQNNDNEISFFDPSIECDGPRSALVNTNHMNNFLVEKDLVLVWLIGGEKMVVGPNHMPVQNRLIINSVLWTDGNSGIHSVARHHLQGHGFQASS